jgi:hypothetical protein
MIQHLIHWRVLALHTMVGVTVGISQRSQCVMPTDLKPGRNKIHQNWSAVAYRAKPLGILRCDSQYMSTVTPIIVRMATVGELEAKS